MLHPKDFCKLRFVIYLQIGIQILNEEQVLRVEGSSTHACLKYVLVSQTAA